jgi:hypothetical protein
MTVPFADFFRTINFLRQRPWRKIAGPGAKSHCSAQVFDVHEISQLKDNRLRRLLIKFRRVRVLQSAYILRKLYTGRLHTQTDSKVGRLTFPRVTNSANHSRYASLAKAAGNQYRVKVSKPRLVVIVH